MNIANTIDLLSGQGLALANMQTTDLSGRTYLRAPSGIHGSVSAASIGAFVKALLAKSANAAGGMDIICHGDSIGRGGLSNNVITGSMFYTLASRLRSRHNPPGVAGGVGFIPVTTTSGTNWSNPDVGVIPAYGPDPSTGWNLLNVSAAPPADYDYAAGRQMVRLGGSNASGSATFVFKSATSIDLLHTQAMGHGAIAWTVTQGSITVASGNVNASGQTLYGKHTTLASGLDPSLEHVLTLPTPIGGQVDINGVILYNGDERCGVRLHNMCNWGARLGGDDNLGIIKPSDSASQANALAANVDRWAGTPLADNSAAGSTRAGLVLAEWVTNDEALAGNSATKFQVCVRTFNTYCLSLGLPVIWCVPPAQGSREIGYSGYVDAIIAEAEATPGTLVFSYWDFLGRPLHGANIAGGFMHDRGWYGDGTHYGGGMYGAMGDYIYECLRWVVQMHQSTGTAMA